MSLVVMAVGFLLAGLFLGFGIGGVFVRCTMCCIYCKRHGGEIEQSYCPFCGGRK